MLQAAPQSPASPLTTSLVYIAAHLTDPTYRYACGTDILGCSPSFLKRLLTALSQFLKLLGLLLNDDFQNVSCILIVDEVPEFFLNSCQAFAVRRHTKHDDEGARETHVI